jgi:hypothetical protein
LKGGQVLTPDIDRKHPSRADIVARVCLRSKALRMHRARLG